MQNNNLKAASSGEIVCGGNTINIKQVVSVARLQKKLVLNKTDKFINDFNKGYIFLQKALKDGQDVYGITTGYGDSCLQKVSDELAKNLPINLTSFHGCGLGDYFNPEITRAILVARLVSLSSGFSGIRYSLLQELKFFLDNDILPLIPEEGSVGASGDLTPLSYIARALMGREKVLFNGQVLPAEKVLSENFQRKPFVLTAREALAIMNGTSVMTGIACLAHRKAYYLAQLASRITAMSVVALKGNVHHFEGALFKVKPHPGQTTVATWIRTDLKSQDTLNEYSGLRLQDRYSLRCAPHIVGVLVDALNLFENMIELELNSVNDNPVVLPDIERIMHGGHFYGGHMAFAMDSLKVAIANIADMLDRQLALLVDEKFNNGLSPNLTGSNEIERSTNHGFKALQIAASAWTAEALKLTMPASVFSRSTECHNQDKVSMGTIAARDCLRVLELTEQVAAAMLMAASQALTLRMQQSELNSLSVSQSIQQTLSRINQDFQFLQTDRPLEGELRALLNTIRTEGFTLYE